MYICIHLSIISIRTVRTFRSPRPLTPLSHKAPLMSHHQDLSHPSRSSGGVSLHGRSSRTENPRQIPGIHLVLFSVCLFVYFIYLEGGGGQV